MGFRFRKSIKIAPGVKINLNKNSVSATVGTKGAHYTVNSKGKKTASVGIPGTGLSYSTSSGGSHTDQNIVQTQNATQNQNSPQAPKKKGHGCLTAFIIFFVLGAIGSAFSKDDNPDKLSLSVASKAYDINEAIPVTLTVTPSDADISSMECISSGGKFENKNGKLSFRSDKAGTYSLSVSCNDIDSNTIKITIEDKDAIAEAQKKAEEEAKKQAELEAQKKAEEEAKKKAEEEAQKKAAEEAAAQAAAAQAAAEQAASNQVAAEQPQEQMVWIPQSGSKYHRNSSCGGMNNPTQVTLSYAQSLGYEPCKRCH